MKRAFYIMAGASTWLMAMSTPAAWALSVSPARTEVRLAPGEVTKAVITITNIHAEPYDVELSEKPWFVFPENRRIQVGDWLRLPGKKNFRLKPGKSRDVKITITCPKEAVGELMGMVSFAYHGLEPSMITPMISTAIYLEIAGTEKNTGEITFLKAEMKSGRFLVEAQVKATGNVRLHPTGAVRLLSDQGQVLSNYIIGEANPIFPGSARDYPASGPSVPPLAGHYTLSAELQSGTLILNAEQGIRVKPSGDIEIDAKKEAGKP